MERGWLVRRRGDALPSRSRSGPRSEFAGGGGYSLRGTCGGEKCRTRLERHAGGRQGRNWRRRLPAGPGGAHKTRTSQLLSSGWGFNRRQRGQQVPAQCKLQQEAKAGWQKTQEAKEGPPGSYLCCCLRRHGCAPRRSHGHAAPASAGHAAAAASGHAALGRDAGVGQRDVLQDAALPVFPTRFVPYGSRLLLRSFEGGAKVHAKPERHCGPVSAHDGQGANERQKGQKGGQGEGQKRKGSQETRARRLPGLWQRRWW
mmetsp:Transcript_59913/g.151772  ORF Transcript_59913/g.151772 Transcript_59913/m.151772 type:complete len:258 (+) Transcript_59913:1377-2150(+)